MTMNIRGKILLFVALIAGTFCALVTKAILNQIPDAEETAAQVQEKTIPTMVAKRDLLPGDEITPQNIRFDRLPESQVPTEAVNYFSDAKHRILVKGVGKGQLISIYDLNESESSDTGYYTPLNSSCASFLIGSVIGSAGKGEAFLEDIRRNVVPGVDRVDFYVTAEKREEDSPDGGKILQRTSVVKKLLYDVDIYQVRVIQKPTDLGQTEPRLEFSFILNDAQLEMIAEAEREGRVTIEFSGDSDTAQDASPLFEVIPAAASSAGRAETLGSALLRRTEEESGSSDGAGSLLFDSAGETPLSEETAPGETGPSEEISAPVQPAAETSLIPSQTAEVNTSSPPRMSVPRPRMTIPRPDANL